MKYLSLFAILVIIISCTPTKSTNIVEEETADSTLVKVEETTTCETIAKVQDNSGLDGCKYLIILEDGKKLEPLVILDKSFKLRDGQNIRLTYEPEREFMSICMAGQGVRVTCIQEIK